MSSVHVQGMGIWKCVPWLLVPDQVLQNLMTYTDSCFHFLTAVWVS